MLDIQNYGSLVIVKPLEPLTLPHAVALLHALERIQVNSEFRNIILDLAGIKEADGSGLGSIVNIATKARAAGQKMYLYRPSKTVAAALKQLEIDGFFPLFEYEEDLLALMPD